MRWKSVGAPREAEHLPHLFRAAQLAVEHGALQDDIARQVVQPMRIVVQVWRLVFQLASVLVRCGHVDISLFLVDPLRTCALTLWQKAQDRYAAALGEARANELRRRLIEIGHDDQLSY
jgi:hypothetical protein